MQEPKVNIHEIFRSFQAEGPLAGLPTTFIRFTGCDLACKWCDTVNTKIFDRFTPESCFAFFEGRGLQLDSLCFTGGEPTLRIAWIRDFINLVRKFFNDASTSCRTIFQLETHAMTPAAINAAVAFYNSVCNASHAIPSIVCSPKLPSSLEDSEIAFDAALRLVYGSDNPAFSLKLVIGCAADFIYAFSKLRELYNLGPQFAKAMDEKGVFIQKEFSYSSYPEFLEALDTHTCPELMGAVRLSIQAHKYVGVS